MKKKKLKNVVVQGLGYVGSATLAAISTGKNKNNTPLYNLIGLDLIKNKRINLLIKCFFNTADKNYKLYQKSTKPNFLQLIINFVEKCRHIIVNVPLDIITKNKRPL